MRLQVVPTRPAPLSYIHEAFAICTGEKGLNVDDGVLDNGGYCPYIRMCRVHEICVCFEVTGSGLRRVVLIRESTQKDIQHVTCMRCRRTEWQDNMIRK